VVTGGLQRLRQHIEHESIVIRAENAERVRLDHLSGASIPWGNGAVNSISSIRAHIGYSLHLKTCEGDVSNACCVPSPSMKISCAPQENPEWQRKGNLTDARSYRVNRLMLIG
jgi:hypothetical protein